MFSTDDLGKIKDLFTQFSSQNKNSGKNEQNCKDKKSDDDVKEGCISLTPSQILVIAGLLSGVFNVDALVINRNQNIEVVLTGTLKRKTQLDQIMEQIGKLSFEQVVKSIIENV